MREILFRGKRVDNGKWVEGCLFSIDLETYSEVEKKKYTHCISEPNVEFYRGEMCCFEFVIPETIGQSTGLTDKNGKKIFEGDIVEGHCHSQWSHRLQRCVVEYDRGNFEARHYVEQGGVMRYYSYKVLFSKDVVVIGNIHDNPELLKGGVQE